MIPNSQNFIDSVAPGGPIILSGILKYDADEVLEAFTSKGCVLEDRLNETEWCALAIKTPGKAQ